MTQQIQTILIDNLHAHPDNPNRMGKDTFTKLVRNIERTGRYEPIIVRRSSAENRPIGSTVKREAKKNDMHNTIHNTHYEIINGHHRVKALRQLGYKIADCLVWDVDDHEAGILLATLNRLGGSDTLEKKLALLKRLNQRIHTRELAKLLPHTAKQIERLTSLKLPAAPATVNCGSFLNPMTFFVNNDQYKIIRQALELASGPQKAKTKTNRNAAALTRIAESFIETIEKLKVDPQE